MDKKPVKEILDSIRRLLQESPRSINELSKEANINWKTAAQHLEILKNFNVVEERSIKNTRTFFYKDSNNYFGLPIKEEHKNLITTIYAYIKKFCQEIYKIEPTKTQAYKIIWNVDRKLNLGLPIGWYKFGPCCVQIYQGNEEQKMNLNKNEVKLIRETTQEYCLCDNFKLQNQIYKEVEDKLYLTKEELLKNKNSNKEKINSVLIDFIKFTPKEAIDVATDFARTVLLLGFNKIEDCFDKVWKYIAAIKFRDSLKDYYKDNINIYLDRKIENLKKEAQLYITDLVRCNVKAR